MVDSSHELLRSRLLAGVVDPPAKPLDYRRLRETQWSAQFEKHMRDRLVLGAFRYGDFTTQERLGRRHRNVESIIRRAREYIDTGNQELLVDIANLAMVEFIAPGSHPAPHFSPVDDGTHVEVL